MRIKKCRLCNSNDIKQVLNLKPTPVGDDFISKNELCDVQPTYPLDLFLCEHCGHVQLGYAVDPNTLFKDYVYTSSISTSLLKHFEVSSSEMIDLLELGENDLVVDIGSNDGSLLRFFNDAGINVIGIDPAVEIAQKANESGIETIADFFTQKEGKGILGEIRKLDFLEQGILDSLDIVFLATYIEEKFGQKIDITDDNILQALRHFNDIVKLVS